MIWLMVPSTIRVELSGAFAPGVCARDLALKIVGHLGAEGAVYKAVEFCGPAAASLPMDDRITLCNLMVEAGAWKASELVGEARHGLVAEVVTPGFDYADHEFADAEAIARRYPQHLAQLQVFLR